MECPDGPIASVEPFSAPVSGLPMSSLPPMAMNNDLTTLGTTLDYYAGSTAHVTNSPEVLTEDLFAGSPATSLLFSSTTSTTTTTSTTHRQRRTRPTRRTRLTRPPTSTTTTEVTKYNLSTTLSSTTTSTTSTGTTTTTRPRRVRPTRITRPSTTKRRRTSTTTTTTMTTTTTTRRRRTRPTESIRHAEKGPIQEETTEIWILPEVDGQKIEISDLEIDSSLEEYLYTTQSNPTFVNALDTLRDWAVNRKIEVVKLPRINVRSSLEKLTEGMNSILKADKHK